MGAKKREERHKRAALRRLALLHGLQLRRRETESAFFVGAPHSDNLWTCPVYKHTTPDKWSKRLTQIKKAMDDESQRYGSFHVANIEQRVTSFYYDELRALQRIIGEKRAPIGWKTTGDVLPRPDCATGRSQGLGSGPKQPPRFLPAQRRLRSR